MIIQKIEIQGFGPHTDTVLSFKDDIHAIIGHNGAGKTFALEAIPAVLFGVFPSRGGSIMEHITQGHLGDALIAIEFEMDGVGYRAERKVRRTAKTASQECYIYKGSPGYWMAQAGPKQDDYKAAIFALVGDSRLFMSSVFSSQNMAGDLIDSKPTERKVVLADLLGLDRYQEKSDLCRVKSNEIEFALRQYEMNCNAIAVNLQDEEILKTKEESVMSKKGLLQIENSEIDSKVASITLEIQEVNQSLSRAKEIGEQRSAMLKRLEDVDNAISSAKSKINDLENLSLKVPELERHQESLKSALIEQQKQVEIMRENQVVRQSVSEIDLKISEIKRKQDSIENEKKRIELEALNSLESKKNTLRSEIRSVQLNIQTIEQSAKILDSGDFTAEQCKACKFTSHAFSSKSQIPDLTQKLSVLESELTNLEKNVVQVDTSALSADLEALEKDIEPLKSRREELVDKINPIVEVMVPQDRSEELANAKTAQSGITEWRLILNEKESHRNEIDREIKTLPSTDILDVNHRLNELNSKLNELSSTRRRIQDELSVCDSELGAIKNARESNLKISSQLAELDAQNVDNKAALSSYQYLATAFGRNGIQALLIDAAIPSIQAISDELLHVATEGRMRIQISTQKELRSGGTSESLEILCSDDTGVRDVQNFSGGEQKILRTIFRMSLAIFQASRSNIRIKTLFIDEIFDALDQTNAYALLETLNQVSKHFERVIFISHSDDLLSEFGNKIELVKSASGTRVVQ